MSKFFGYVDVVAGVTTMADVGAGGLSGLLIGNESGLTVIVAMQGNNTSKSLYPGTVDWFPVNLGTPFNGNVTFKPEAKLSNVSTWPGSFLQIDTFGPGERPEGIYPMALPRNSNIGNVVPVANGIAQAVQDDGRLAGSSTIEATVLGDVASTVSLTNDGKLTLGTTSRPGQIMVNDGFGNNQFLVDATGNVTINSGSRLIANAINAQSGNDLALNVNTGQRVRMTVNSVVKLQTDVNGLSLPNQSTLNVTPPSTSVNGQTSGTVTVYQDLSGTIKRVVVYYNNYINTANQTIALNTPFTTMALVRTGQTNGSGVQFLSGGAAVNMNINSSVNSGGGTANGALTTIKQWSFAEIEGGFDSIRLTTGMVGQVTGIIEIVGI